MGGEEGIVVSCDVGGKGVKVRQRVAGYLGARVCKERIQNFLLLAQLRQDNNTKAQYDVAVAAR